MKSAIQKYSKIYKSVKEGKKYPFLIFAGVDDYIVSQSRKHITGLLVPAGSEDVMLTSLDADENKAEDLSRALNSMSLFSSNQVVTLKAYDPKKAAHQKFTEVLNKWMEQGRTTPVLILEHRNKLNVRGGIKKKNLKSGAVVEFPSIDTYSPGHPQKDPAVFWIQHQFRTAGIEISPGALKLLRERTDNSLWALKTEIDKLVACKTDTMINESDVMELVPKSRPDIIFELMEAAAARNVKEALQKLDSLMKTGAAPIVILTLFVRQIRLMLQAQVILRKNIIPSGAIRANFYNFQKMNYSAIKEYGKQKNFSGQYWIYNQHPYVIFKTLKQTGRFRKSKLTAALVALCRIDYKMKRSSSNPRDFLAEWIIDLCRD